MDHVKYCFLPNCKNSSMKTPGKVFFSVPKKAQTKWCHAVGMENVPKGSLKICEDHLNLEEDIENFTQWKYGFVKRSKLKDLIPFGIQKMAQSTSNIESAPNVLSETNTNLVALKRPLPISVGIQAIPKSADKAISCKRRKCEVTRTADNILIDNDAPEEKLLPSQSSSEFSCMEDSSQSTVNDKTLLLGREYKLNLCKKRPFLYLGLHKKFYWLIEYLAKEGNISTLNILIVFYKLKNNDSFLRISDEFQLSRTRIWQAFPTTLNFLASFFKQLIFWPSQYIIKKNLPNSFKINKQFSNVQSIIDCFEIEIEKPSDPIHQSLTWSDYKSCNTIKYLVGSTPEGFINFISKGFGGRITDVVLVEQCGFLDIVPQNCTILADRGFKHLESILAYKTVKLLRPPSVYANLKCSKLEVIQSKTIASLRVHIERVIRRLRVFKILKPHSVVNKDLLDCIDNFVIVACGLNNLQSPIIKKI